MSAQFLPIKKYDHTTEAYYPGENTYNNVHGTREDASNGFFVHDVCYYLS